MLEQLGDAFPEHLGKGGSFETVFDFFVFTVARLPIFVRQAIQKAVVEFIAFGEKVLAKAQGIKEKAAAIFSDDTLAAADARLNERLNVIEEARKGSVAAIEAEADANIRAGEETYRRLKEEKALRDQNAKAAKAARDAGKDSTRTGATKEIGGAADQLKIGEADTQEAIKNLERIYQAGEIGLDQYAAKKRQLTAELAALLAWRKHAVLALECDPRNVLGFHFGLRDIPAAYGAMLSGYTAAIIGVPHPKWQERPLLVAVRRPGAEVDAASVLAHLESRIAKWWLPDDVVFVESLPHTATGKLLKTKLREQFKDHRLPTA